MARIDFYATHLLRHSATGVELTSGQPVLFRFPTGDRKTNQAIDHPTLVELVKEAAPGKALEELRKSGRCTFTYACNGIDLGVRVTSMSPTSWRVGIEPSGGRTDIESIPSMPAVRAAMLAEAEPVIHRAAEKRSIVPPKVEVVPGEPKLHRYLREMVRLGARDLHLSS
jgi:hypothetical protein